MLRSNQLSYITEGDDYNEILVQVTHGEGALARGDGVLAPGSASNSFTCQPKGE